MLLAVSPAYFYLRGTLVFSWTSSLKYRLFYIESRSVGTVRQGEYVLFKYDDDVLRQSPYKINLLLKEVKCVAGDTLTVVGRDYFCNGEYLGHAKELSFKGVPVKNFIYNGTIPEGELFLMGQSIDSYDSRYFGLIPLRDVEKIVYPLF